MRAWNVLVGVLVVGTLVACAPVPRLKLGLIVYDYATDGNIEGFSTDNAARLAADDLNRGGKIHVELVTRIVTNAPEASVDAVRDLVNRQGVAAIVGPSQSVQAIPAGGAAEEAGVVLISAVSSNPATTLNRRFVFRMCFLDPVQAAAQVAWAARHAPQGSASVVYRASDPSSAQQAEVIRRTLAEAGRPLRRDLALTHRDPALPAQVAAAGPWTDGVVFIPADTDFATEVGRQLRARGFRGLFVGGDGWSRETMRQNPDFEGAAMTTNYWRGQTDPGNEDFVARYTRQSGRPPGDTAALTYDAVGLVAAVALRIGRTDPASLRDGLADGTAYQGIAGPVSFHGSGDPRRPVVFLTFSGGVISSEALP